MRALQSTHFPPNISDTRKLPLSFAWPAHERHWLFRASGAFRFDGASDKVFCSKIKQISNQLFVRACAYIAWHISNQYSKMSLD
jgi:hypothetical protein